MEVFLRIFVVLCIVFAYIRFVYKRNDDSDIEFETRRNKTLDAIALSYVPTLPRDTDVSPAPLPDVEPRLEKSQEYNRRWALPDEILPANAIHRDAGAEAFETELNARYEAAKQRHQSAIADISYPIITNIDPSIAWTLNPAEKLFLWYIDKKPVKNPKIGVYWRLNYNLYDFQHCIIKLMKSGLLDVSRDPAIYLHTHTVEVLRQMCRGFGLSVSGRKQQMIDALLAHDFARETIQHLADKQAVFRLTERGKHFVLDNQGLIFYHKNRSYYSTDLTLKMADQLLRASPSLSPQDALNKYCLFKSAAKKKKFLKDVNLYPPHYRR